MSIDTTPLKAAHQPADPLATQSAPYRIPLVHVLTSLVGLGPIPFTKIIATLAMVAEANRNHTGTRQHDQATNGTGSTNPAAAPLTQQELATRARVVRSAQKGVDKAVSGPIESRITSIKALLAEINILDKVIAGLTSAPVLGSTGEKHTYTEATQIHNETRERIDAETRNGSHAHLLKPSSKLRDLGTLLIDLPVFVFAMIGLLNVNLRMIGYDIAAQIKFAVALTFSLLGTILLGVVMRTMGRRHRAYKTASGATKDLGGAARRTIVLEITALAALIVTAAGVMASRVVVEGTTADASPFLIAALATLFALLIGFTAYINYRAELDNGSPSTDKVQHLSRQLRGRDHQLNELNTQRQVKVEQAGVLAAKLARQIAKARTTAERKINDSTADKSIHIARSYHHDSHTALPDPGLDHSSLELAQTQATQLAAHHSDLQATAPHDPTSHTPSATELDNDLLTLLAETTRTSFQTDANPTAEN